MLHTLPCSALLCMSTPSTLPAGSFSCDHSPHGLKVHYYKVTCLQWQACLGQSGARNEASRTDHNKNLGW